GEIACLRVHEDRVGPGLRIGSRAAEGLLQTQARDESFRPRDDREARGATGGGGGLDLPGMLLDGDQLASYRPVKAAPLRKLVVLDAEARRPRPLEFAHGADHVDGVTVAVVAVSDNWDRHGIHDPSD